RRTCFACSSDQEQPVLCHTSGGCPMKKKMRCPNTLAASRVERQRARLQAKSSAYGQPDTTAGGSCKSMRKPQKTISDNEDSDRNNQEQQMEIADDTKADEEPDFTLAQVLSGKYEVTSRSCDE